MRLRLLCAAALVPPALARTEKPGPNNESLLWGPYRPNLYLGIRPRVPESLLMGLMWSKLETTDSLRHTCEQNEGMQGYGWTAYDTRKGGSQTFHDAPNMLDLTTEFVKLRSGHGKPDEWGLRVRGSPRSDAIAGHKSSVIFYVAMEAMGKCDECKLEAVAVDHGTGDAGMVDIQGQHPGLGDIHVHIPSPTGRERLDRLERTQHHQSTSVTSMTVAEDTIWDAKAIFLEFAKKKAKSLPTYSESSVISNAPGEGNMHFVQLIFEGRFEFDVFYSAKSESSVVHRIGLSGKIQSALHAFSSQFVSVFGPKSPYYDASHVEFAQSLLSNLLGGLGFFYGDSKMDASRAPAYQETALDFWDQVSQTKARKKPTTDGPYELFSHVPSRTFFPRGFLWDEGFHLLTVLDWDADLAIEVLDSWFALMNEDGWIAREQILGPEARSKVPPEFQVQYPQIANPPTLFLVISALIDQVVGQKRYAGYPSEYLSDAQTARRLVENLYPHMKRHYTWFRGTQWGDVELHSLINAPLSEGYRWRGRTPETNLASGLDDYPRAYPPHPGELHLDALCWVGIMARVLKKTAEYLDRDRDASLYDRHLEGISTNIDAVHWSSEHGSYCDSTIREDQHEHVCPRGYVALFPLLSGFLGPDHPQLGPVLGLLRNPDELWSQFGIRSLSPQSKYYGTGDNYWRGPIWININYMILEQLLNLAVQPGQHQRRCKEIYVELRRNVVATVYNSWKNTGFAWEQYNPELGHGQRTQHFTGWTALVVKIMAMPDLERGAVKSLLLGPEESGNGIPRRMVAVVGGLLCAYLLRRKLVRVWRAAFSM